MNSTVRRAVAATEVFGGILGLVLVVFSWRQSAPGSTDQVIFGLFAIPYILSVLAGVALWNAHRKGVILSLVVQSLQAFQVTTEVFSYIFISGLQLTVGYGEGRIQVKTYVGSLAEFMLSISSPTFLGINLVPIAVMIWLVRWYVQASKQKV